MNVNHYPEKPNSRKDRRQTGRRDRRPDRKTLGNTIPRVQVSAPSPVTDIADYAFGLNPRIPQKDAMKLLSGMFTAYLEKTDSCLFLATPEERKDRNGWPVLIHKELSQWFTGDWDMPMAPDAAMGNEAWFRAEKNIMGSLDGKRKIDAIQSALEAYDKEHGRHMHA